VFAIDRGGLVGADGATHHGAFDLSFLRCLPNMTVMTPSDVNECRRMLFTGAGLRGPSAIRYPRGTGPEVKVGAGETALEVGKAEVRRHGQGVAILAFGSMLAPALVAGEALDATVVNMRFVKPLDTALVLEIAAGHELVVTVEENVVSGGAGSAVAEALAQYGHATNILHRGLPDRFVDHGDQQQLLASVGLDPDSLIQSISERVALVRDREIVGAGATAARATTPFRSTAGLRVG
jgi:1-deoxy-D-xylulose-5-phosphate synthase